MAAAEDDAPSTNIIKTSFLDLFGKLTLDKEKLRAKGGVALVRHLARNSTGAGKELKYTLARLVRGLGADSGDIKRRYFPVLVALLSSVREIDAESVLEIVEKELSLSASNSKSENADAAFGQILTCGALIRAGTEGDKRRLVEVILSAGKQRSYLYLPAVTFILELCNGLDEDEFKKSIWPFLQPELPKTWQDQTVESLYFLLSLRRKYPDCKKLTKHLPVISEDALPALANLLMTSPPHVDHPVYLKTAEELTRAGLAVPFINEVDSLAHSFNYNRHSALTKILRGVVASSCPKGCATLPKLLTKSFMSESMRHLKASQRKDDVLHASLCELFESITGAQLDVQARLGVLEHFLFHPTIPAIDRTARSLIAALDEDGVKILADSCKDVMLGAHTNKKKVYASKLLAKLLGHPRMQGELHWKTELLKFLMEASLLKTHARDLSALLRDTFFQALDLKLPKLEDLRTVLSELVHHLETFLQQTPECLRRPLNPVALETWQKTMLLIAKLERKNKIKHVTLVFLVLFLHMSLQLFNEVKLANGSLEELALCYERVKANEREDVHWIEVVVDLFLSLLSRGSHLLRGLIRTVFPHLCKYVNATALHQILFVLDPAEEDNPLSPADLQDSPSESDSEPDGESDSEPDEEEKEDDGVNDKLKTALQAALNAPGSDDEDSLDLDAMSDGEGKRLDEALADAFKQFKPNSGRNARGERKDKEALTHFRLRVLDLLDVYFDASPAMLLCLEAAPPLLRLLRFCAKDPHQEPLANKARSTLEKVCATKKFGSVEDVNGANLRELLRDLLDKEKQEEAPGAVSNAIAECCAFAVRCVRHLADAEGELDEAIAQVVRSTNQSALSFLFVKKILQSTRPGNTEIVKQLVEQSFTDEIRMFRRVRVLELLRTFYTNRRALAENAPEGAALRACELKFVENSVKFLADPGQATQAYVSALFGVLGEIKRNSLEGDAQWEELAERLRQDGSNLAVSRDARNSFRVLCKRLGLGHVVKTKKRKLSGDSVVVTSEKRLKTRAPNAKQKKNRKERRALRVSAMSEGLGAVNFSDAQANGEYSEVEV